MTGNIYVIQLIHYSLLYLQSTWHYPRSSEKNGLCRNSKYI